MRLFFFVTISVLSIVLFPISTQAGGGGGGGSTTAIATLSQSDRILAERLYDRLLAIRAQQTDTQWQNFLTTINKALQKNRSSKIKNIFAVVLDKIHQQQGSTATGEIANPTTTGTTSSSNNNATYTTSYKQVSKTNQDPIVKKIGADGKEVWSVTHDTSPVDVRAEMVRVDAQGNPRVVFTLDGGSNDNGYITKKFVDNKAFSDVVFPSFGRAKGAFKGAVIAQLDPTNGKIIKATFLMSRTSEGDINAKDKANSISISDLSFDAQGNIIITARSRYLPPKAGSTAKNYLFHPNATDKTKTDGAWNVIITLDQTLSSIVDSRIIHSSLQ